MKILGISDAIPLIKKLKFYLKIKRIILTLNSDIVYAIEGGDWVIDYVGNNIVDNLKKIYKTNIEIASPIVSKKKIIHYGSINCLVSKKKLYLPHKSNKTILTWYHVVPHDYSQKYIPILNKYIDIVLTSNNIAREELIKLGFSENKVKIVPLGIDLKPFGPLNEIDKEKSKDRIGIPKGKYVIGSFQKDGIGWDKGIEPKLIKGPDILCEVLNQINKQIDIHVLLTGPARGYVKNKLDQYGISYNHSLSDDYNDLGKYYKVLDLYIISSRVEGGPLSILESMASGVPIVTTRVGMVPDILVHNESALISDTDDIELLVQHSLKVLNNNELREKLIRNGLELVKKYSWKEIVKDINTIYKSLIGKMQDCKKK